MVTRAENELLTRIEGDAPMGTLIREHYWMPFALSSHLAHGDAPMPVRLLGENYVAFRADDGRVGFFDELCPHRRASLALGRIEGNGVRCIYHGWKIDVSGCVVEAPTQVEPRRAVRRPRARRSTSPCTRRAGWRGCGSAAATRRRSPTCPSPSDHEGNSFWCVSRVPCNWLQGVEGTIDSAHVGVLHQTWMPRPPSSPNTPTSVTPSTSHRATRPRPPRTACGLPRCDRRVTVVPTCASPSTSCRS